MRIQDITEITRLGRQDYNPNRFMFDREFPYHKVRDRLEPLPGGSGLAYTTRPLTPGSREIVIADPTQERVVGFLDLVRDYAFPLEDAYRVRSIGVDPSYRNRGIGRSLYGIHLSIDRYPLLAGREQTPGGRKSWLKLSQIPGVTVRGYVPIADQDFDRRGDRSFDQLLDTVMSLGGDYLDDKDGVHYFSFDVVPGSGELKPAVARTLALYDSSFTRQPGLYAVWQG